LEPLLKDTGAPVGGPALLIECGCTYLGYLSYVSKEHNIIGRLDTSDEEIAQAGEDHENLNWGKTVKGLMKDARIIPPAMLDMVMQATRHKFGVYDNADIMQKLADCGFVCIDKQFAADYSGWVGLHARINTAKPH